MNNLDTIAAYLADTASAVRDTVRIEADKTVTACTDRGNGFFAVSGEREAFGTVAELLGRAALHDRVCTWSRENSAQA